MSRISSGGVLACLLVLLAACAQTTGPAPAREPDASGSEAGDPRLRSIRSRKDPAREEPGVGVGGLMHDGQVDR